MNYDLNMPLSDLVAKLLQGEADELHEEDLHAYMDNLTHGDKKGLQQALKEVEKSIVEWKDTYFVETYADKVRLYQQGKLKWTQRELDDLFYEEEFLRKEGKTGLTVDYLYNAIEKIGFINELHGDAIECAWQNNDIEFLRTQWEDLALDQIRALQAIINGMLRVTPTKSSNEVQSANRPEKQLKDYPEVLGIDVCCKITGYKKNTIYKLTAKNKIPHFRPGNDGRKLMFRREEVLEWMIARRRETTEEFINSMDVRLAARNKSNSIITQKSSKK